MFAEGMMFRRRKRPLLIASCLAVLILCAVAIWLLQEVEYQRINSPDGQYTAIVTYRRTEAFLPIFPGQSGDKPGFIKIEDRNGNNCGKIGVPMIGMSRDLEWTDGGANLDLVCEWNFAKRECRFWNIAQTKQTVKHAR